MSSTIFPRRCGRPASISWALRALASGSTLVANRSLLVPVTPECGARRGHRGRICGLSERRDGDQQDQRENSDECPHGTSPHDISPYCGILSRRQVKVACDDPILGYCFPLRRCPSPIEYQTAALFLLAALGHARAVNVDLVVAPEILLILPGLDIAVANRRRPLAAHPLAALRKARRCQRRHRKPHGKRGEKFVDPDHDRPPYLSFANHLRRGGA